MTNTNSLNNNFPNEIIDKLLPHLPRASLLECQKVCKSWNLVFRPYFWEHIEIKTSKQAEKLLQCLSDDIYPRPTEFVTSIVISRECKNDKVKKLAVKFENQLLLHLPHLEQITLKPDVYTMSELSKDEFLKEFREKCPIVKYINLQLDPLFRYQLGSEYSKIQYVFRNTLKKVVLWDNPYVDNGLNLFGRLIEFPLLEEIDLSKVNFFVGTRWWWWDILKLSTQIKSLSCFMNCFDDTEDLINNNFEKSIEENNLKKKIGSIEELNLELDYEHHWILMPTAIKFITKYFVGLKNIKINGKTAFVDLKDLLNFTFSRDIFHIFMVGRLKGSLNILDMSELLEIYLQNNFHHTSSNIMTVVKHLQIGLRFSKSRFMQRDDEKNLYNIALDSKKINHDQLLRTAKFCPRFNDEDTNTIYNILNSTLSVVDDIDELTFCVFGDSAPQLFGEFFPFSTFNSIIHILNMTSSSLKKIRFEIAINTGWDEYFAGYEERYTCPHIKKLELMTNIKSKVLIDGLPQSQFITIFPNIEFLTVQFDVVVWKYEEQHSIINLPQLCLNTLSLDVSYLNCPKRLESYKRKAKTGKFSKLFFILDMVANEKMYHYQVFFDGLRITPLSDNHEYVIGNYLKIQITLKKIRCLRLFMTDRNSKIEFNLNYDLIPSLTEICENKLYFI